MVIVSLREKTFQSCIYHVTITMHAPTIHIESVLQLRCDHRELRLEKIEHKKNKIIIFYLNLNVELSKEILEDDA